MNLYLVIIIAVVIAFYFWRKSKKNQQTDKEKITDRTDNRMQGNTTAKFCGECGDPLDEDTLFCGKCGTAVTDINSS